MRIDEVAEAVRKINALQPCPYCGAVKHDTLAIVQHLTTCPLPAELVRYEASEIS